MGRDHQKLTVFHKADELVILVYRLTKEFPVDERFGLRAQIRRAALSIPTNIVEGTAREGRKDYMRFLDIALASSAETAYLLHVSARLGYLAPESYDDCSYRVIEVRKMLEKLLYALRGLRD